jgi:hypothetical protein
MPIGSDIQAILARAYRDLDATHDFFTHSQVAWRSFQDHVTKGYKFTSQNFATGTIIDQDGLVRLAAKYTEQYLATFTFRQFVSTFEVFLFDVLHLTLRHNPWQFAAKRLEFEVVLKAKDRDQVMSEVILKQLNELKYEKLRDWFDCLNKAVKLPCPSDDEIDALAEIKATRDLLEHNSGVVNDTYLRKAGKKARFPAGALIEIDEPYHLDSWRIIKKVVNDVASAATAKLTTP